MKHSFALVALISVAAFAGDEPRTVQMTSNNTFVPETLTIKEGTTVVWENQSQTVHTVTDDPAVAAAKRDVATPAEAKPFNSGSIQPGGKYSNTFTVPGTYKYVCLPHEGMGMIGTIVVTK
jgi:plastocyanin